MPNQKERNSVSKVCLFVSNISFNTTDSELEAVFSSFGHLRACYTVKDKGKRLKCRGFGYVTFVHREDALKAQSKVKVIAGRPINLVFAKRKVLNSTDVSKEEKSSSEEEEDYETLTARDSTIKQTKARSERTGPKYDVGKIIVIQNLPAYAKENRIRRKCEVFGAVNDITYPLSPDEPHTAHVAFDSHKVARSAVEGVNNTRYKKKQDDVIYALLLSKMGKVVSTKTLKKSRLIVHNLSFSCSEEDVEKVFRKYGSVVQVHIPRQSNGLMFGYCFVQFSSYFAALKARSELDATTIKGRQVKVDFVLPKAEYHRSKDEAKKKGDKGDQEDMESDGGSDGGSGGDDSGGGSGGDDSDGVDGDGDGDEEGYSSDGTDTSVESNDKEGDIYSDSNSEEVEEAEGCKDEENDVSERKPNTHKKKRQDLDEGRTVFIRNLPLDADSVDLKKLMLRFGLVRYCQFVSSKDSGVFIGSAFVQFKTPTAAQRCLQATEGVVYNGHLLNVAIAISQEELSKKFGKKEKEDKRNLYLAKEGVILEVSDAPDGISKSDLDKRKKAYLEKKAKLEKSHFFVSKTRLCVRNLPTKADERKVKSLFQIFAEECNGKVLQVKIMRSTDRVDGRGLGRSKGYGFVELSTHDSALYALRKINNNPDLFGKIKRPIVEFAVEDGRIVRIREIRKAREEVLKKSALTGDGESVPLPAEKVLTKRQKWQLKWQKRRVRRKEEQQHVEMSSSNKRGIDGGRKGKREQKHPAQNAVAVRTGVSTGGGVPVKRMKLSSSVEKKEADSYKTYRERRKKTTATRSSRRTVTDKEETNFMKLVDEYKNKLERQMKF